MIARKRLEWRDAEGGARAARPDAPAKGRRLLAFAKLEGLAGISLGAPHFAGGEASFYELDDAVTAVEAKPGSSFEEAFVLYETARLAEGEECIAQGCCLPLQASYRVDYSADGQEALITPLLRIFAMRPATLCACLKVDGFELLPSARASLKAGLNSAELRAVKLVRPRKHWPKGEGEATAYRMELELADGSPKPFVDVRDLSVWGEKA